MWYTIRKLLWRPFGIRLARRKTFKPDGVVSQVNLKPIWRVTVAQRPQIWPGCAICGTVMTTHFRGSNSLLFMLLCTYWILSCGSTVDHLLLDVALSDSDSQLAPSIETFWMRHLFSFQGVSNLPSETKICEQYMSNSHSEIENPDFCLRMLMFWRYYLIVELSSSVASNWYNIRANRTTGCQSSIFLITLKPWFNMYFAFFSISS